MKMTMESTWVKSFITTDASLTDSKTTVHNIRSVQIRAENEMIYEFLMENWQVSVHHKERANVPVIGSLLLCKPDFGKTKVPQI